MLQRSTTANRASQPAIDYRIVVAVSLALSVLLTLTDPLINRDAILYLSTAEAYLQEGLIASLTLFDRPFLSIIIAILHRSTGLSLLHAGLVLNALFYAILCTAFVSVVRLLGGDRRIQIFAAIVILSHPMIAAGRESIMRDPPYWAFSLLAFRALLLYMQQPVLRYRLQWFGFISIATIFRFEGLFFALLAPLAVFFSADKSTRLETSARLLILPLVTILAVGAAILLYQTVLLPGSQLFPDIGGYVTKLVKFPQDFAKVSAETGEALLVFTAKDDAGIASLAGLAAILVVHLGRALMWPYVILLLWGVRQKIIAVIPRRSRRLLNFHLIIALVYLGLFTLTNRFMLERYCHIFTIFIALYLPFILNAARTPTAKPLVRYLALLLMVGMVIDVVGNFNYKKMFIRDATEWITAHTDENATLVSNNSYLAYFSERNANWGKPGRPAFQVSELRKRPTLWHNYDYLAARIKPAEEADWQAFIDHYSLVELQVFDGGGVGRVSIVEIPAHFRNEDQKSVPPPRNAVQ